MNIFKAKLPVYSEPKNKFDLSHERKQSTQWGRLDPILSIEVVPGDEIKVSTEIFMRFSPMLAPIMHRADVYVHYFYVPYRLVWDRWNDFITSNNDPVVAPVKVPQITHAVNAVSSDQWGLAGGLMDLMGLQTGGLLGPVATAFKANALPFRCYQEIYNEWYRDELIIPKINYVKGSVDLEMTSIPQLAELNNVLLLRKRAWEKDYATTARPNPQFGSAGAFAPVISKNATQYSGAASPVGNLADTAALTGNIHVGGTPIQIQGEMLISELRKANALQLFLEKMGRSGNRIAEVILQMFGVQIPDTRAVRPEYLGGFQQHVRISEVLSSIDATATDNPLGTFAGNGHSSGQNFGFQRSFPEHGQVIGIMSVIPKAGYQQQMPRDFIRESKYDYYWPAFANLGEQEVKNREVAFMRTNPAGNDSTFGYQSRYSEYKYKSNTSHGDFKNTLLYWHLDKVWNVGAAGTIPALNQAFIEVNPSDVQGDDLNRIFAVSTKWTDKMWAQIYHNVDALRPMPVHSIPRL